MSSGDSLTLLLPSAALYLNSSPRYEMGGCWRLLHSVLMKAPLRSSRSPELFGRDAASWMILSYCARSVTPVMNHTIHTYVAFTCMPITHEVFAVINDPIRQERLAEVASQTDI